MKPRLRDRVAVIAASNGKGDIEPTKRVAYQRIDAIYETENKIRTSSGDIWEVRRNIDFKTYKAKWLAQ